MTYQQPSKRPDHPIWSGRDWVRDLNLARNRFIYIGIACGAPIAVVLWLATVVAMLGALEEPYIPRGSSRFFGFLTVKWRDWLTAFNVALVYGGSAWGAWRFLRACEIKIKLPPYPSGFLCREWKLVAREGDMALSYKASEFSPYLDAAGVGGSHWAVSLDEIARVESGRTAEWIPHRAMAGGPLWASGQDGDGVFFGGGYVAVPPTEYQTFLFLNDGSRRVISTLHNGRAETAKLAASVRAWVEKQRAAPPEERVLLQSDDERGEGFDL